MSTTATANNINFGFFFFNSDDENISGNYALHAKNALITRIAEQDPRVRDPTVKVISGDLFGAKNIQTMLTMSEIKPSATLLDADLRLAFTDGRMPGFTPYLVGFFTVRIDALQHADKHLRRDKIAGYRGLATFTLQHPGEVAEVGRILSVPMTSLHSASESI